MGVPISHVFFCIWFFGKGVIRFLCFEYWDRLYTACSHEKLDHAVFGNHANNESDLLYFARKCFTYPNSNAIFESADASVSMPTNSSCGHRTRTCMSFIKSRCFIFLCFILSIFRSRLFFDQHCITKQWRDF